MTISIPAIAAICVAISLLSCMLYLLLRLWARSAEVCRLMAAAAEKEELDRRERIERDRAVLERVENISESREAQRVRSILSPNMLVINV